MLVIIEEEDYQRVIKLLSEAEWNLSSRLDYLEDAGEEEEYKELTAQLDKIAEARKILEAGHFSEVKR